MLPIRGDLLLPRGRTTLRCFNSYARTWRQDRFSSSNHEEMCKIRSVDDFGAFRLEVFEAIPHLLQLLDRMPLPLRYLSNDTQGIAGAVGEGRIAGKLLIGQVGVINNWAGRLDQVDARRPIAGGELRSPDGGIECGRAINP
jgi:hypothetical protein